MITSEPKFFKSPYFVMEKGNWHLKPGAPQDIVDEFNEFNEFVKNDLNLDDLEQVLKNK